MDEDAWAVRHFEENGLEMLVSQSFGKNLGLYGDRIGFLTFVVRDQSKIEAMKSQLTLILRPMYGNPCRPAATLIEEILLNKKRRAEWNTQLMSMVNRIQGGQEGSESNAREAGARERLVKHYYSGWNVLVLWSDPCTGDEASRAACVHDAWQWQDESLWDQLWEHPLLC
eukprot:TRINITY_DN36742_c0_g1_i1.p1 TRINITY_DN36742_c0_g1~~TRINITY_DN36742_c0_g1_i1.p1  ORF type:complete len:188 (-),score=39.19 TRINITY_DN36742_c0_g1_i1:106-615(-)